ncbi:aldehyde dehydrogenase family protein [Flavobacterium sp. JP2137]|uniref:aldehyde dehydrogenase family protein n=1 Tax=Flavobacterium sp. JP2137 TaxID=3414510 RepID=UPI003D2FDC53
MNEPRQDVIAAVKHFLEQGTKLLLIDGQWKPSSSKQTIPVLNPATESVLAEVALADRCDVDLAVAAAKRAYEDPNWTDMDPHQRGLYLIKIADLVEQNAEELALLDTLDEGMPFSDSLAMVKDVVKTFRYYAGWPARVHGFTNASPGAIFSYTNREPLGVCGAIIPWNAPFIMAAWKIAPVIAFGNTVVLKPSELTPLSALRLGELILESGLPRGVVNILPGTGAEAGAALVAHHDIAKIAFTGSTAVGKSILSSASSTLKKVSLELGGKSPNIIFEDADLDQAIQVAVKAFTFNTGQGCVLGTRIFIQESVYNEVSQRIIAQVKQLKVGSGVENDTDIGPITNINQFNKVQGYFKIAQEQGATLEVGGETYGDKGYFIKPTVFTNVSNDSRLAQEEIFGPVAVLIPFSDEKEVIQKANDTNYGLGAGIWTRNLSTAHRVAKALNAGTVWINTYLEVDPIAPFGGYKQSGMGRELGQDSMLEYTQVKTVLIRL